MVAPAHGDVTALLRDWSGGDPRALERLMPLVYGELRKLAASYLRRERSDHTLQPTALVHEAYLRLVDQRGVDWHNRAHFFGIAARMMRRILVDHARRRQAAKRDGAAYRISGSGDLVEAGRDPDLLALNSALDGLEALDPRQARIIELRFFGGLTVEEVARVLGLSTTTVESEWRAARAWLAVRLGGS